MQSIKKLKNLKNKKVIVRVDFNVPIRNGKILDDYRIKKALPTINFLRKKGAKIILISHLGDESGRTLKPVATYLNKFFKVDFCPLDQNPKLESSNVVLLENLRINMGEEKNNISFAKKLASYADIYVNEAFSVCHRKHASIVSLPKYLPSYAGLQLEEEIKNLKSVLIKPLKPFLFILGGAKFETKIPLINKFIGHASKDGARHDLARSADQVFIGGALANNFFKERGWEIGQSLVDEKNFGLKKILRNEKLILPIDVLVFKNKKSFIKKPYEVAEDEYIADIGPESVALAESLMKKAKMILWNGPMGNYEQGFGRATEDMLKVMAKVKGKTIVGGGDTVALISKLKLENKLTFVSTGGGATLEFLARGTLPGIEVLN